MTGIKYKMSLQYFRVFKLVVLLGSCSMGLGIGNWELGIDKIE